MDRYIVRPWSYVYVVIDTWSDEVVDEWTNAGHATLWCKAQNALSYEQDERNH